MKKNRVLLTSCAVILLCICIITGMSFALFTDSVSVKNHLKAGNLDIQLKRTNLEYSVLNADGELATTTVTDDLDLTTSTDENVFGIDSSDIRIVPGSYFEAELEISNAGNTAFTYNVGIHLLGASTLSEQLQVTVTHPNGTTTTKMLSELAAGLTIDTGKMKVGDEAQTFTVRVDFINDVDYNAALDAEAEEGEEPAYMNNNEAQSSTAVFDLVVTAVQATTPTPAPAA